MGLLDKLKPQPRWRHADAAVRLDALRELDDAVEIAVLSETDPDARVRKAAIARVTDIATLSRVASGDAEPAVRSQATEVLVAIASASADEDAAVLAVGCLTDPKILSTLAKSRASESACLKAVERVEDSRALGAIARHAAHEPVAAAALDRLADPDECLDVALNADHKNVALAAFDRLVPAEPTEDALAILTTLEAKAHQKAVARKAKSALQALESAREARRKEQDDRAKRELAVCEDVERLAHVSDAGVVRSELDRLAAVFESLGVSDPSAAGRYAAAVRAAEEGLAERARAAEAAAEAARQRAEAIATREALCVRVETLDGDDVCEQLVPIEEEWRSLTPLVGNGPEADRVAERFAQAVAACRKRHEMGAQLVATRESLLSLVTEAEGLPALEDRTAAAERWRALSRDVRGLAATLAAASRPAADLAARWKVVAEVFDGRDLESQEAKLAAERALTQQAQRLAERARRAVDADAITLREGERLTRDIATGLETIAKAADRRDLGPIAAELTALQEKLAPRVRDLRELEEWRRFANAQRQEQLIAMAEAIVTSLMADDAAGREPDLAATARALRDMQAEWQKVAEAPRHSAQRLWERFRSATGAIRTRCESYFAKMRTERVENLQKRTALVEEAEALATSTDWGKAAGRFQELQAAWQALGGGPKDAGRELGHRFRAATNAFFARRREDLLTRKKAWADNLAKKEALCARAEAIAESTDWESTTAEMKRLQAEWKTIGPVRRSQSEVIWARFRGAADRFFERYHNRHNLAAAEKIAARERVVVDLELLVSADEPPADLAERVQTIRAAWSKGMPAQGSDPRAIAERWHAAFTKLVAKWPAAMKGTEFDPEIAAQRLTKLVAKVEQAAATLEAAAPKSGLSATELMAAKLRSALASNAMGGRSTEHDRVKAAADTVREAQAAWQRLAPLAGDTAQALEGRFHDACRKVTTHTRHQSSPQPRRSHRTTAAAAV